jgi:FkbM family methyltransferase
MKTISGAPLSLRMARTMSRSHVRGAGVLTRMLGRLGVLDRIAQYELGTVKFGVPLGRMPWDLVDITNYEARLIEFFCRALDPLRAVTFLDCGADIGTFSALVCSRTDRISRIIAFEPNRDTHEFLRSNLSNLAVPYQLVAKAASNFAGRGRLDSPPENPTDHARFLVPGDGPLEVITVDSLKVRGGDIAIKLDIEGGELEALEGAVETIAAAHQCVIAVEASPAVAKRTRRDPVECLRFLTSVRPFHFLVAETRESPTTANPLLKSDQTEIWNVVGWTYDGSLV